jgi:Glycosyl hydrolases family 16
MITRRSALVGIAAAAAHPLGVPAVAQERLQRDRMRLTFEDTFEKLDLYSETSKRGRWRTQFGYGGVDGEGSRCNAAGSTCYVDAAFTGGRFDPFAVKTDAKDGRFLEITAIKTPPDLLGRCFNRPHISGTINTKFSFAQQYGYFEILARIPVGKGYFPAFWALPKDNTWTGEIDVFESIGQPDTLWFGLINPGPGIPVTIPRPLGFRVDSGFHTYGVWWDATNIIWYVDGVEFRRLATPPGCNKPFYWIINFAVGGKWAGEPPPETPFPATLAVARFSAYQLPT